jgi:hypothetical protein
MEMRKCGVLVLCLVVLLGTTACSAGRDIRPTYPRMEYRNSSYNLDPYNREVPIESGYVLDEAHSYDVVKTDGGYDIVFHFVKGGETDGNENSE